MVQKSPMDLFLLKSGFGLHCGPDEPGLGVNGKGVNEFSNTGRVKGRVRVGQDDNFFQNER
jgi:hypothetical protein